MSEETKDWKRYVVTAGDLRAQLSVVPDDTPVILQKDAEGNGYSPLARVDWTGYVYEPESTWSGEVHSTEPDPDDTDPYRSVDGTPVVLLGPVN